MGGTWNPRMWMVSAAFLFVGLVLGMVSSALFLQHNDVRKLQGNAARRLSKVIDLGIRSSTPGEAKLEPVPQVCVVAGVGPGIGEHVARRFAVAGCKVALLARDKDRLANISQTIPRSRAYPCDVTDPEQVKATFSAIHAEIGAVDALIYNVGGGTWRSYDDVSGEALEMDFKTNALGLLLTAQQVGGGMAGRGHGVIGITGATSSWRGLPQTAGFAPRKFASRGLAQSLARDLGPKGVHVFHVVVDGGVHSPQDSTVHPQAPPDMWMHPEDIAETYYNLAVQPRSAWTFELSLFAWADHTW
eukprot:CAMPEP_0172723684 /NCGR_PEP_ID=MMETSP1074-20121228/84228_1 /TAXON_ID=2916 /ORGANISM="Ceratium fusus, Strain PA161109" /LENGTH=301 /DNA_ID=CAMNT_0013549971 /DNA_START=63 /DNA_END=965 /DNA_ORIENTATION=+